jgi:outer membrane protein assembly factor BamD
MTKTGYGREGDEMGHGRAMSGSGGRKTPEVGRGLRFFALAALLLPVSCASANRFADLGAEELYSTGVAAFEAEDWDAAIEAFGLLVRESPGHPRNPEARIYTARAHAARKEFITAAAEYETFLQQHPGHGLAPEASLGICRAYAELSPIPARDQTYTREAIQACSETALQFRGLNVAEEAQAIGEEMWQKLAQKEYEEGRQYHQRGGLDSAILIYAAVVEGYPDTPWAPRALLAMVRAYRELGWDAEAEDEAARLLRLYPASDAALELQRELGDEDPPAGL